MDYKSALSGLNHIIFGMKNAVRIRNAGHNADYFKGATEVNSHLWEQRVQSPWFNQIRLDEYRALMIGN
jgi:hypothetical protein